MQIFELESFKLIRTHRFDDAINDFTIFAEAGLVAAQVNQQTSVINLLTGRLIRKHSTNLDTSSSAFLRYIDVRSVSYIGSIGSVYWNSNLIIRSLLTIRGLENRVLKFKLILGQN